MNGFAFFYDTKIFFCFALCLLLSILHAIPGLAADIYVDKTYGNNGFDGLSWATAKRSISVGLVLSDSLTGPDTVHVAEGIYYENITLVEYTDLLGGYPSGGGSRDPATYISVIDGSTGDPDDNNVVTGADNAVIDGFTITNATGVLDGFSGDVTGGAVVCMGTSPTISNNIIKSCSFHAKADWDLGYFGGTSRAAGIYCKSSSAYIYRNEIKDISTLCGYGARSIGNAYGGGIYCEYSSCTIEKNTITSITTRGSRSAGAGIYCLSSSGFIKDNCITDNTCTGTSDADGAGIYVQGTGFEILRNSVERNSLNSSPYPDYRRPSHGGGIYCEASDSVISGNTIESNSVDEGESGILTVGDNAYGGGIYVSGSNIVISTNNILKNSVRGSKAPVPGHGYGGGIHCVGDIITIENNIIKENIARGGDNDDYGGGTAGDAYGGGINTAATSTKIQHNEIFKNTARGGDGLYPLSIYCIGGGAKGGGILCDADLLFISQNFISENQVISGDGYAADTTGPSTGGGIQSTGYNAVIENNVLMKNLTRVTPATFLEQFGGGVFITSGDLVNNTFIDNIARVGGGVYVAPDVDIINNIFTGHDSYVLSAQLPPASIKNNDFYDNPGGIYFVGTDLFSDVPTMDAALSFASANISCPPNFNISGYHLTGSSCCIDTGTSDSAPSEDFDGDSRPLLAGYDIGADEYSPSPAVPITISQFTILLYLVCYTVMVIVKPGKN